MRFGAVRRQLRFDGALEVPHFDSIESEACTEDEEHASDESEVDFGDDGGGRSELDGEDENGEVTEEKQRNDRSVDHEHSYAVTHPPSFSLVDYLY